MKIMCSIYKVKKKNFIIFYTIIEHVSRKKEKSSMKIITL